MNLTKMTYPVSLLLVGIGLAVNGYSQSFLTNGLVAYYPFNGNANDASGNGNNGTVDGATLTADRFGNTNSAYYFNGVSSDILVPETIFGPTNAAWTVSLWITFDGGSYAAQTCVLAKSSVNGQMGVTILANQVWFGVMTASQGNYLTSAPLLTNSVMHVVGVYQKGQSISLYINGLMVTNTPVPNENLRVQAFPSTSSLGSSHYNYGPFQWFRGVLDDFRVYTRALSASEVQQLYAYESAIPNSQSFLTNGLVAYYPFNGNANDASGNGNNGTVEGATLTADRFGNPNSAYSFNGVNGDILVPETLFGPTDAAWSVSVWFTSDSGSYAGQQQIYTKGTSNGQIGIAVLAGQIQFAVKNASQAIYTTGAPLLPNSTTHVVGVYLKGQSVALYTNGVLASTTSIPNENLWVQAYPLTSSLGSYHYNPAPSTWLRGVLDDFRVYSRALSASEVQQLYAYESGIPCVPHRAAATVELVNGFVVGATITDGGCGYTNTPRILIQGGGGTGAAATAVVSNGVVVELIITDAGFGYTSAPTFSIGSPFGVQVALTKAVRPSFSNLMVGLQYQLQVSSDLLNWTNQGSAFTATATALPYPQYWDVDNWSQLYFRLKEAP